MLQLDDVPVDSVAGDDAAGGRVGDESEQK